MLVLVSFGSSGVALAEPAGEGRAQAVVLFERAMVAYKAGKYAEALPLFQHSHDVAPSVGALMYAGECQLQSGKPAAALASFREAGRYAAAVSDKRLAAAEARAAEIEKRVSYLHLTLAPEAQGASAEVTVNGVRVALGAAEVAVPVDPGVIVVAVSAPGHEPRSERIASSPAGERYTVTLGARRVPQSARSGIGASSAAPSASTAPPTSGAGSEASGLRTLGFVGIGAGAVGSALGGFLVVRAIGRAEDAKQTGDVAAFEGERGPYRTGVVVLAASGVLAAAGIVLVLTHPRKDGRSGQSARSFVVHPAGGGALTSLAFSGRF